MRFFLPIIVMIAIFFSACGYKPSSKYAREVIGEKVSTSIKISSSDPENSVIIKDAVDGAIISIFHSSLRERSQSDTHLVISLKTPKYTPIEFDVNGFVIAYRMSLTLVIKKIRNGVSKIYTSMGTHDFSITPNAIVTDQERFEAIKFSAQKAINSFIAQTSVEGARVSNTNPH
ncbi:MAG: hypothetical protein U9P72_04450 [Campylobacterota bacterium]|nr:hypothetical protein [Campylobacterota bacterium]